MTVDVAPYVRWFRELGIDDIADVGGKNASLGELHQELAAAGVRVPDGFAVTGLEIYVMCEIPSNVLRAGDAEFLVAQGIDSISLNPDALLRTLPTIAAAETAAQRSAGITT